ncbi:succinate dehydrogenase/fumarate reductase iron-sulfur subunit, partial [Xanthomonas citri pv. citri]|nr:succinate dehydrogenase/fumarate reductase iron-sulfur subunit [Xanthomonas citri pv. citri]
MANLSKMTIEVLRYNPETDSEAHLDQYEVPFD